jgi:crotonobetaine/carnitine-CoA ligase
MRPIDLSDVNNRRLGTLLRLHAARHPDRPFLLTEKDTLRYAEANARCNGLAAGLAAIGIRRGDRVAILMDSAIDYVLLALALNKIGALWVPLNTDYRGEWLAQAISDSQPAALVVDGAYLPRVQDLQAAITLPPLLTRGLTQAASDAAGARGRLEELALPDAPEPDDSGIHYGDTVAVLWTSGTTGRSKGVMQHHNAWVRAAEHSNRDFGTTGDDVVYNCMPLYNSAAWVANIFRALVAGVPCALDPQFSVKEFWQRIRRFGATQTMTLGAMHMFLWAEPARADDADNPLRMANMVPMPEPLVKPFCERFGLEGIMQGFGQSEVMLLLSRKDTPEKRWKPNALGAVGPGIELRMLDAEGVEVPAGEVGEFCVRPSSPHVMFNGYFANPEATAAAFHGEWYRTGDLGIRDAEGDYFFVDRKKDVIRYKGRNVSSVQVEGVVLRHPAVQGAAVYGVPSKELDSEHEIKLDVVLRPGAVASEAELARHVNAHAPHFCVPRYIEFVDALPYTPTNKVQKYKLRERGVPPGCWDRVASGFVVER